MILYGRFSVECDTVSPAAVGRLLHKMKLKVINFILKIMVDS